MTAVHGLAGAAMSGEMAFRREVAVIAFLGCEADAKGQCK